MAVQDHVQLLEGKTSPRRPQVRYFPRLLLHPFDDVYLQLNFRFFLKKKFAFFSL